MIYEPTVFLVDDDDAIREALRGSLQAARLAVQCFDSGESFLNQVTANRSGCLLIDLCMPGLSGLDVQEQLSKRQIKLPIVFMTAYGTIRESVSAVKGGAIDFLEKPVSRPVLLERIQFALDKDRIWRESWDPISEAKRRFDQLSPREAEVMALIVAGNTSKQIARVLHISPRTVDVHRAHLMLKMNAASPAELGVLFSHCTVP